jgi:hypothetical protein
MLIELNRLFSFDDLIAHYGGPRPLWEKLRPGLPVFSVQDGVALYLESQVDAFLKAVAEGVQLNRRAEADSREGGTAGEAEPPDYITVAEAQRRFLAGARSLRWWYRMAQTGRIAHHRVGDSVLFRTEDILAFIEKSRRKEQPDEAKSESAPPTPPTPVPTLAPPRTRRNQAEDPSRFQFFPRR